MSPDFPRSVLQLKQDLIFEVHVLGTIGFQVQFSVVWFMVRGKRTKVNEHLIDQLYGVKDGTNHGARFPKIP